MDKSVFPKINDIPESILPSSPEEQNTTLLDGRLCTSDLITQEVYSPVYAFSGSEKPEQIYLGSTPLMNHRQAEEALHSARRSFYSSGWKEKSPKFRADAVRAFLNALSERREKIVNLLMLEIAKSRSESDAEFTRTIEYLRATADTAEKMHEEAEIRNPRGFAGRVLRTPRGVIVTSGPSNYPLFETYSLSIPALLAGNSVIMKIPRFGALLHYYIIDLLAEYFPAGTINTIFGKNEDTLNPIMRTGEVDMLAYFGNSMFAEPLIFAHPKPYRLHALLGLEAKNPAVVFPDADIETAAHETALGSLAFNGQRCAAVKIIYAHKSIYEEFISELTRQTLSQKVGMPWTEGVKITPVFDLNRIQYLTSLYSDAIESGAIDETKSGGKFEKSLFYPVLLSNVNRKMRLAAEEQFGPIVPVMKFEDISEIYEDVKISDYGQQISLFGKTDSELARAAEEFAFSFGRVNINTKCQRGPDVFPFTGKKNSALGELSFEETLREFSVHSVIAGKDNQITKNTLDRIL